MTLGGGGGGGFWIQNQLGMELTKKEINKKKLFLATETIVAMPTVLRSAVCIFHRDSIGLEICGSHTPQKDYGNWELWFTYYSESLKGLRAVTPYFSENLQDLRCVVPILLSESMGLEICGFLTPLSLWDLRAVVHILPRESTGIESSDSIFLRDYGTCVSDCITLSLFFFFFCYF